MYISKGVYTVIFKRVVHLTTKYRLRMRGQYDNRREYSAIF